MSGIARSIDANWADGLPEPERWNGDYRSYARLWERADLFRVEPVYGCEAPTFPSDLPRISRGVQMTLIEVRS